MIDPDHPLAELLRRDRRYHRDAYFFVFEALRFAQEQLGMGGMRSRDATEQEERHITGQQLCEAIRQYAVQQYGMLAKNVLNEWGVQTTGDFGEIVYNLIEIGEMKKTATDRREDFDNVFDFDDGLHDAFLPIASDS
ncbi:MAG TPA: Minf_1886 family protein [Lacipirellulaceae bacterium]|nr:Minf_1886 family protein [Lacipirellulaceae bacterium]